MNGPRIQNHIRENYERTEDQLHRVLGVMTAIEVLHSEQYHHGVDSEAISVLIGIARETVKAIQRAHDTEWARMGGTSSNLSAAEIAAARGVDTN